MIVTCRYNRSSDLADHQRRRAESLDTEYDVTIGAQYIVLGMMIWKNILDFLIRDDSGGAGFYAAGLFECHEKALPAGWLFSLGPALWASGRDLWVNPCGAVWGYDEFVRNSDHSRALQEGDEDALAIFFRELIRREEELAAEVDDTRAYRESSQ